MPYDANWNNDDTNLCYSTDKKTMGDIRGKKPFHKSKEQKLNIELKDCQRFGDTYGLKAEMQKEDSKFNRGGK
jgi:hypothetical protein